MKYVYTKDYSIRPEDMSAEELLDSKSIYFHSDSAEILFQSAEDMILITKALKKTPELKVEVIGYAEEAELKKKPKLAEERAQKVIEMLVNGGVKKERLRVGKPTPVAIKQGADENTRAKNRRVDFSVVDR